jgi:hypothetical protein
LHSVSKTRGWTRWLALTLPLVVVTAAAQQRLYFIDEARLDSSFVAFRTQLRKALAEHNAAFVRSILYPGIELDAAGDQGPEEFERLWNPDDPKGQLWAELDDLLALGGSFTAERRQFCAPYVYSNWPKGVDQEEKLAIIAVDVQVHATCDLKAPVVGVLSHDLVTELEASNAPAPGATGVAQATAAPTATPEGWARIEFGEGKKGCVRDDFVRSPLDYHACFEKIQGKWMITVLMAEE